LTLVRCRCYSAADCAAYLKTCPFSEDTNKGKSLADCLPDKSDFKKAACSADAKGKLTSTDGKAVPLAANVTCFASQKLTCEIYRNATGHSFITAGCKAAAKKASSAQMSTSLWQCCLLLALLVGENCVLHKLKVQTSLCHARLAALGCKLPAKSMKHEACSSRDHKQTCLQWPASHAGSGKMMAQLLQGHLCVMIASHAVLCCACMCSVVQVAGVVAVMGLPM
jgi:hypothetical protein